eukprot:1975932-Prymnesium_polylepis.1
MLGVVPGSDGRHLISEPLNERFALVGCKGRPGRCDLDLVDPEVSRVSVDRACWTAHLPRTPRAPGRLGLQFHGVYVLRSWRLRRRWFSVIHVSHQSRELRFCSMQTMACAPDTRHTACKTVLTTVG